MKVEAWKILKVDVIFDSPVWIENGIGTEIFAEQLHFTQYVSAVELGEPQGEARGRGVRSDRTMSRAPRVAYALRLEDLPEHVRSAVKDALDEVRTLS